MAKSITEVAVTNTFQNWLDKTNELVDLMNNDVLTASPSGDTTVGNAILNGTFTATNLTANTLLRVDNISPKTGSTSIAVSAPFNINTNQTLLSTITSSIGPRIAFADAAASWQVGFENITTRSFIISATGEAGTLRLNRSGDLEVTGTVTATSFSGNLIGNVSGNLIGNVTGNVTGNVSGSAGTVNSLAGRSTADLAEGTNLYFTTARARSAISGSTGISYNSTTGVISIGQPVSPNDNVTFPRVNFKATSDGNDTTYITQDVTTIGPLKLRSIEIFSNGAKVFNSYGQNETNLFGKIIFNRNDRNQDALLEVEGTITSTGAISSQGDITAFASSSDIRKKENIVKISNALDKVSQINGYTYNFKGDSRKITGVIAQELEKVLPEAVYEIDDEEFGGKSKAVRYGNIVGLLIEAIKELQAEVKELKNSK